MRNIIALILFIILLMLSKCSKAESSFCKGYEDGYSAGWCYGEYSCLSPITPICPIPTIYENGYNDGYNRGFSEGKEAKESK